MESFAKRLLELRKEKGISQAALAKELNISKSVVHYWETNQSEITAPNIVLLSKFFDVSTDYLLGLEN